LKNVEEPVQRFLSSLQPFGTQLGPVLFQLPPNLKADAPLLREFLALLPTNFKAAFEFRHDSWFNDDIYAALSDRNVAICIAETEKLATPEVHNACYAYYRFRKPAYSAEDVQHLAGRVQATIAKGLETYAFFKHEEDPRSPLNAVDLLQRVAQAHSNRAS
jgi:uncharacterized protein YecE (DUF72 family)